MTKEEILNEFDIKCKKSINDDGFSMIDDFGKDGIVDIFVRDWLEEVLNKL